MKNMSPFFLVGGGGGGGGSRIKSQNKNLGITLIKFEETSTLNMIFSVTSSNCLAQYQL
jgi:hypothetical protein